MMDSKIQQQSLWCIVNGETVEREVEPRLLLSDFIRHELGLTGTHVGCEHGCLLYTSPSPRDRTRARMPSSA